MRLVAISDLHGNLPEGLEAEICLIGGDISPLDIQFNMLKMEEWLSNVFCPWILSVEVDRVFLVAGNHDAWFERATEWRILELQRKTNHKLVYLRNDTVKYTSNGGKEYTIFGTPYCHIFGRWPFMRPSEKLTEKFKEIPEKVDIILSHDPPFGISDADVILQSGHKDSFSSHIGNHELTERLREIEFKYCFCGHIHSGSHELFELPEESGKFIANISLLDEAYDVAYRPLVIEI